MTLVLASRTAGDWWQVLARRLETAAVTADTMWLAPLAADGPARQAVARSAAERFAAVLGTTAPLVVPLPPGEDAGHALSLHMAALVAVDAARRGQPQPSSDRLSAYLLQREREHWQAMHEKGRQPLRTRPAMMARAAVVAALTGALPYADGLDALTRAGVPAPEQVIDDHRSSYPPQDPVTVLEPLAPTVSPRTSSPGRYLAATGPRQPTRGPRPRRAG